MNVKVTSGIVSLIESGILNITDLPNAASIQSSSASGIVSIQQIDALPAPAAEAIRNVFRNGIRWAFISLIPWVGVAAIMSLFLSNICDPDCEERERRKEERRKKEKEDLLAQGEDYTALGPKPTFKFYFGLTGMTWNIIKTREWNRNEGLDTQRRAKVETEIKVEIPIAMYPGNSV